MKFSVPVEKNLRAGILIITMLTSSHDCFAIFCASRTMPAISLCKCRRENLWGDWIFDDLLCGDRALN